MKNKAPEKLLEDIRELEILESIGDAVSIQDTNFKIIFQNKTGKEIMGDHTGKYCYEAYAFRDKTCNDCPLSPVFADGKTHTIERSKPSDNGTTYFEVTASPLRNSSGKIIAGIEVTRNITERKEAEEALRTSEEHWRSLVQTAPNIIYTVGRDNLILFINYTVPGFSVEQVIGTSTYDYIPQEDHHIMREAFEHVFKTGETVEYEIRSYGLQDTMGYYSSRVSALKKDGKIEKLLVIATEITKYKQAAEAIKESEQRFRQLIETAFEGITITENAVILEANEPLAKLLGYEQTEIIGMPISKFVTPESFDIIAQNIRSEYDAPYEIVCVRKDGKHFPAEVCGKTVIYKGRKARMAALRDITERKRLEEESMKIQKLESLGILAGGIAHDFNNLLTAILGNISLAKIHTNPEDKIYERLAEAEKASMRAKDLTQQLLTFSKGGEPVKKTVSLKGLIHDTACFALRGSKTKCECRLPDNLWPVEIDEGQITQVFHNLLINADHAMPEGGVVDIHAENITSTDDKTGVLPILGKYVKISVHDNGIGIPKDHLMKIFDPYFTTKQKGSGLGLTSVFSIIRKHDGMITVESEQGKGTAFHIYLPASSKEIISHEKIKTTTPSGKGKILIMDDDDMVRHVAGEILKSVGYKVEFAKDGTEAIDLYQKAKASGESFDVVIMDLTIQGGMGGREAIKKLLTIDPQVRAVVSSGYSNDPIMSNFKDHGFSAVISKPYNVADMSKTLHDLIDS